MSFKFKANIPDEPFKVTFTKGNTVEITYKGPKYLVISVSKDDNRLHTVDGEADTIEEIDLNDYEHEERNFHIIDAHKHPLVASIITHFYDNAEYPDYEEELPTGEKYIYLYENAGILGNIYKNVLPIYFPEEDRFSNLELLEPALSKEQIDENIKTKIETYTEILETDKTLTDESKISIRTYLNWLENIEETYAGVDHWKIPFKPEPIY